MKSQRQETINNQVTILKEIEKEIKSIVEDDNLDPEDANEQLAELNKKLAGVITNLGKI